MPLVLNVLSLRPLHLPPEALSDGKNSPSSLERPGVQDAGRSVPSPPGSGPERQPLQAKLTPRRGGWRHPEPGATFQTSREHDGATLGGDHVSRRSRTRALDVILHGGMTRGNA